MDPIRVAGVGSGLDLESLIQRLVAAEKAGPTARFNRVEAQAKSGQAAFSGLAASANALKAAAEALKTAANTPLMKAAHAQDAPFSVQLASGATNSRFSVEVESLARAQRLRSEAFVDGVPVGHGTLTLEVGGNAFSIDIAEGSGTPAEITAAINGAEGNTGVQAIVINGSDGPQIVFSATQAGAENTLRITADGGDGGLDALRFTGGGGDTLTEIAQATDASILVDGVRVTSSSNSFSDVLPGVSFDLLRAEPGASVDVSVEREPKALGDAVQAFVNAYNATQSLLTKQTRFDAAAGTAGALQGDATVRGFSSGMRRALDVQLGDGEFALLSQIGLSTTASGELKFDRTAFDSAAVQDLGAVKELLTGAQGLSVRMSDNLSRYTSSDGAFAARQSTLDSQLKRVADDRAMLQTRLERVEQRMRSQFAALDTLVAQLQSSGDFLAQQLAPRNLR